jgi:protein-tyrosine phosphatase
VALTVLRRFIPLDGAFNLRDLGGYSTADGRSVRWRTLFRADGMHRLSEPDLDLLRPLGLRTVIDLRSDAEVARGRFPVEAVPVDWYQLSVIDVLWDPEHAPADRGAFADFLYHRYREMLDLGGPHFAEAIRRLAAPGALPGLFHCAAGKDRTGLLAALVLSGLGVGDDDVAADYALSQEALDRLRTWAAREHPELATRIDEQPAAHLAAEPAAMRRVLQWIGDEHGSTRGFLGALGVGSDVVDALATGLLE